MNKGPRPQRVEAPKLSPGSDNGKGTRETPLVRWQATPTRRSPESPWRHGTARPRPRAAVSASLSGGGMHGIHTGCLWGRASFLPRQPHAGDPQVSKWGWGTPVRPARCPASIFLEDWGDRGEGQRQLHRECRAPVAPRGAPWAQRVAPGVSD